jgi:uncharacterized membrane protein
VSWLTVVLRVLHILFGVFWIGSLFTVSAFVMPTAATSGPDGMRFMRRLALERGLTRAMVVAATVTVLAGIWLVWIDSNGFLPAWFGGPMGIVISIGALAGIGALVVGIRAATLVSKLDRLMSAIEASAGPPGAAQMAQAQALGARLKASSRAGAIQGAIAVLCMAVARYVVF